jgi:hypothetical protein
MKQNPSLTCLVPIIFILAIFAAIEGLITIDGGGVYYFTNVHGQSIQMDGRGIYKFDSLLAGAGFRGTNAVTLIIALPLLLIAYITYLRGSINGRIILTGAILPFLYCGASLTFSAAYNNLFLVYTAMLSASLFATITAITSFDLGLLTERVKPGFPYKSIAIFLIASGIVTLLVWMSELLPSLVSGVAPETLGPYTTMYTHGFDSAIITPTFVIIGKFLLQRKPIGILLAAPLLIFFILVSFYVIGQSVYQYLAGLVFPIEIYISMVGSWIVMGILAFGFIRSYFQNLSY